MTPFITTASAFVDTLNMIQLKRMEDSVFAGRHDLWIALTQAMQGGRALSLIRRVRTVLHVSIPSWYGYLFCLLPALIAPLISTTKITSEAVRKPLIFAQAYYGTLCQLAALIASFILLACGNASFAIPTMAIILLGFLDRAALLPDRMRRFIDVYAPIALMLGSVAVGDPLTRCMGAASILSYCLGRYQSKSKKMADIKATPETIQKILKGEQKLVVNREYVHFSCTVPVAPEADFGQLPNLFDQMIQQETNTNLLQHKLKNDRRFTELAANITTDADRIAHVRECLQTLITHVKEKKLSGGSAIGYEPLENYFRWITLSLQENPDLDVLLRLAVDAGGYCITGVIETLETLYIERCCKKEEIPFPSRVLSILQNMRDQWLAADYHQKTRGSNDLHGYTLFANAVGDDIGPSRTVIDNDCMAMIGPFKKMFLSNTAGKETATRFFKDHTVDALVTYLQNIHIPLPGFFTWLNSWIQAQEWPKEEKDKLGDELSCSIPTTLFEIQLATKDRIPQPTPSLIRATLYTMGILLEPR
jgi:hypothetical protein